MLVFSKTRKVGGSIVTTIPKEVVKDLGLKENETVELEIRKPEKSFFGAFKKLSKYSRKDRVDARE